ncbi:peritrophic matrix protein 1-B precursor [Tribolium castaneum]|uniref:Peritrophic matrix protein 1-B n=1 Tax=Tribolium castaneum TaxID=7070 RepID=D1MAI9_TRICA|nr:peritrophic matrix protein 1-B precursor [Tribolium castaneum]ACY95480.1 peritrophic matrix protein 1-B [Tribolium castaneum]EFA05441.1 hypothetical protein TcasGA2_TC015620 [Tribolium castaneum]|eukprot:NP_001161903.1 peritrophic matrix protein 1-B precursor [Tribolium castaneum]
MKQTVFLILFVAFSHASPLIDYRLTLQPPKNCTSAGLLCETCSELVACVENNDHTFRKDHVQTCPSGQKCVKGGCSSDSDPFCDGVADLAFPCKKVGIFPDPFYCNKFVLCVDMGQSRLQAYSSRCEDGLGYNIETGVCDVKLSGGCKVDEFPVPLCGKAGDSGALEGKPMEYYTCEEYSSGKRVLYPVIDVCPNAETYENYKCVSK